MVLSFNNDELESLSRNIISDLSSQNDSRNDSSIRASPLHIIQGFMGPTISVYSALGIFVLVYEAFQLGLTYSESVVGPTATIMGSTILFTYDQLPHNQSYFRACMTSHEPCRYTTLSHNTHLHYYSNVWYPPTAVIEYPICYIYTNGHTSLSTHNCDLASYSHFILFMTHGNKGGKAHT